VITVRDLERETGYGGQTIRKHARRVGCVPHNRHKFVFTDQEASQIRESLKTDARYKDGDKPHVRQ
jgi:hypothetical protein